VGGTEVPHYDFYDLGVTWVRNCLLGSGGMHRGWGQWGCWYKGYWGGWLGGGAGMSMCWGLFARTEYDAITDSRAALA